MPPTGFQIGTVVADRRIDAVVGVGGMGVVYRAWNMRLKRVEAVKVIADSLVTDRAFRDRFERETVIAASFEHPHVVTLYDSGEGPDGQLYIAMRYVEGTNLSELVARRGRLEPRLAAQLISQVAAALDAAHGQGLVHRDIKPANILVAGRDGDHHAYLTDFGLAKQVASRTLGTGTGTLLGTVDYMAPEQARGDEVDALADIYALGAMLFNALTGKIPYPGEHDLARIVAKLEGPPPPVTQMASGIPPAFDTVIARAMAMDPAERYQSAGELGRAARAAAGQPSKTHAVMPDIGVGSVLGDCLLEEIAGEGGMAVVYRATQLKLARTVALKVMSRDLVDDPVFRARFEREWKLASAIDHPNVIPIYAAGETGGVLFIVMRFVGGGSLKEALLARGRLEPERAVEVIEQIASALDAAHERGLVHRDIKPGNVLIEESSGRVFLTDFGLAKGQGDDDLTDRGQILGTARYMPPERNRGAEDHATGDVYSLGCVLWDLLGGTERVKLSNIHGALAMVVDRATALEPADRFASAGELARAARAALRPDAEGAPVDDRSRATTTEPVFAKRRKPFEPQALTSGLSDRVLKLAGTVTRLIPEGPTAAALAEIRQELLAPLRVAIVGPEGSSRFALLNALVGRRVARAEDVPLTATLSVAHGTQERAQATLDDGSFSTTALGPDGSLPRELRALADRITRIEVCLPVEALRALSLTCPPSRRGSPVDTTADAFLVALGVDEARDAHSFAALLDEALPGVRSSAMNTAVVLSGVDLPDGRAAADDARAALGSRASGVAVFVRPLSEAVNGGMLDAGHIDALDRLAAVAGPTRNLLLTSAPAFLADESTISVGDRVGLLEAIGLAGVRAALELADAEPLTVIGLTRRLRELSGVDEIDRLVDGFHQRADALKAAGALTRLEQLSFGSADLGFLRDQVEAVRFEPEMHVLGLTRAFERCVVDDLDMPDDLVRTLDRLITGRTPAQRLGLAEDESDPVELRRAALDAFQAWKMFENDSRASPAARRVARVAARSFELVARDAELQPG
ncbi:MAG: protein kinase domain-containing protein [Solirubrobacteraceae bacterium]